VRAGATKSALDQVADERSEDRATDAPTPMRLNDARRDVSTCDVGAIREAASDHMPGRLGEEQQSVRPFLGAKELDRRGRFVRRDKAANVAPLLEVGVALGTADGDLAVRDHRQTVRHLAVATPVPDDAAGQRRKRRSRIERRGFSDSALDSFSSAVPGM
jgi:hypothetical protein